MTVDASKPVRRSPGQIAAGVVVCVLAAIALRGAWMLPLGSLQAPEAGFVPLVEAMLLALAGIVLTANAFIQSPTTSIDWPRADARRMVIRLALALSGYVLALAPLGFAVSTFLFLWAAIATWRRYRWWLAAAYALGIAVALHLVFGVLLRMSLPRGWWIA